MFIGIPVESRHCSILLVIIAFYNHYNYVNLSPTISLDELFAVQSRLLLCACSPRPVGQEMTGVGNT